MRVNKLLGTAVSWMRVASSHAADARPNSSAIRSLGLLHYEILFYWRGVAIMQYWRSFDHLHAYAHARNAATFPPGRSSTAALARMASVGIWHETYTVAPGQYECHLRQHAALRPGRGRPMHVSATGRLDTCESLALAKPETAPANQKHDGTPGKSRTARRAHCARPAAPPAARAAKSS